MLRLRRVVRHNRQSSESEPSELLPAVRKKSGPKRCRKGISKAKERKKGAD